MLVFSLTACGGNKEQETNKPSTQTTNGDSPLNRPDSSTSSSTVETPDFSGLLAGNGDSSRVWGLEDPAIRQQVIDEARKQGIDVSFGSNGSMTATYPDGAVIVQNPDGSWTYKDESGHSSQYGGQWPENKFTKLVPKPDFTLMGASEDEASFTVAFTSVTVSQIKSYVEKLKNAGFNNNIEENEQEVYGIHIYEFSADNGRGYSVEVSYANGTSGITINED